MVLLNKVTSVFVTAYPPADYNHVANHHRVSPSNVRSPLYTGSPGSAQPQSSYQQALQPSPSDHVNRVHQMASSQHQVAIQSRSSVACSSYSGRMSTAHQNTGNLLGTLLFFESELSDTNAGATIRQFQ